MGTVADFRKSRRRSRRGRVSKLAGPRLRCFAHDQSGNSEHRPGRPCFEASFTLSSWPFSDEVTEQKLRHGEMPFSNFSKGLTSTTISKGPCPAAGPGPIVLSSNPWLRWRAQGVATDLDRPRAGTAAVVHPRAKVLSPETRWNRGDSREYQFTLRPQPDEHGDFGFRCRRREPGPTPVQGGVLFFQTNKFLPAKSGWPIRRKSRSWGRFKI